MELSSKSPALSPMTRLQHLDTLRVLALTGMIVYHFGWDLALFGYLDFADVTSGMWAMLAHIVVSVFLFIVGFSLYLAHHRSFNRRRFVRRLVKIMVAASLVSLTTFIIFPDSFIYFGILHHIALASLIGLVCLRLPLIINAIIIVSVFILPFYWREFSHPLFLPLGLNKNAPFAVDYVPLFPWFAAVLVGVFCARTMQIHHLLHLLQGRVKLGFSSVCIQWLGRHSLLIYLIHQPILLADFYLFHLLTPYLSS